MNPVTDAALLKQIDRYYKDVEETEKKRADYRKQERMQRKAELAQSKARENAL